MLEVVIKASLWYLNRALTKLSLQECDADVVIANDSNTILKILLDMAKVRFRGVRPMAISRSIFNITSFYEIS